MKFLFLSATGDGLGLALRLKQNGHQVAAWIKEKRSRLNYEGLIRKVTKWEDFLDKETIVIFDSTGGGKTADRLRARGHHVFGGSTFADQLELDRGTAFALMEQAGIQVPESKTFVDWEDGKRYARSSQKRLVFKPSGELAGEAGIGSYVSYDGPDMVDMLDYYESIANKPAEFELQEFISGGLAISTEGWFNGNEFMEPFNHTIEHKAMGNDDLGPSQGCSLNIVWKVDTHNHIISRGIKLMEPILRDYGYVGLIDLNTIVTPDGVWALEFTPRFGYDATPTLLGELYDGDFGETFSRLARGEKPTKLPIKPGFAGALRVSIPPAPSEEFKHQGGIPVRGFERGDRNHLYFFEVMLNRETKLVSSPASGYLVAITGYGDSISQAMEGPYALAKKARIPNKTYRTDGVKVLEADYAKFDQLKQEAPLAAITG